jgi:hypothetical protein
MVETVIERIQGEPYCTIYTGEKKFVNKLKSFPDIEVIEVGEGHVKAKVPYNWLRFVSPPRRNTLTEEQRQAASERLKKAREIKDKNKL